MEKRLDQKAVPVEIANEADIKYIDLEASKFGMTKTKKGFARQVWGLPTYKNGKAQGNQSRSPMQQTGKLTLQIFQIKTVMASSLPTLSKK